MRDLFLKKAIEYNDFYFPINRDDDFKCTEDFEFYFQTSTRVYNIFKELMSKNNTTTMREYTDTLKPYNIHLLAHFDIKMMKEITLRNNNCFSYLYTLNNELLFKVFELLAKTHQGIIYFENFSKPYRDLKDVNRVSKNAKLKTLRSAIEILGEFPNTDKEQNKLLSVMESISENMHYTLNQLFQNLYYELFYLLINQEYIFKGKNIRFRKAKILEIVNNLISQYFGNDIKFTKSTQIDKFNQIKYIYDCVVGITLHHR